jgi:hypothetical protein
MADKNVAYDLILIRKLYKEKFNQYEKYLAEAEKIKDYETKWSTECIEFYPYQCAIHGAKQEFFQEIPKDKEHIIESRIKNNEAYYSYYLGSKDYAFFVDTYNQNKIMLSYNFDDPLCPRPEISLGSIDYKICNEGKVDKVISYYQVEEGSVEYLEIYKYTYDADKIIKIVCSIYLNYSDSDAEKAWHKYDNVYEIGYTRNPNGAKILGTFLEYDDKGEITDKRICEYDSAR